MAKNWRIIIEKYSARIRSAHTYIHTYIRQCNMPSIEWQYEAAYLSLLLLLSRAHFYERIHQPETTDGVSAARLRFFLSFSLFSFTVFSYPSYSSYPFFSFAANKVFPDMQKIERREMFDPGQSQRALVTVPNIFTLDVVLAISDKRRFCSTM